MSKIVIGESSGKYVRIDLDVLLSTRLLLTADSGGGKTFALKRFVTELAEAAGFSPNSGGFNNYLGHMRTLGFIDYPAPGKVRCSDWMYVA